MDAFEVALEERTGALDARIDAVTPDDSAVDGKPWTSEKIVEALCPPFETTGSIVQCHPVEHYPLGVVSRIDVEGVLKDGLLHINVHNYEGAQAGGPHRRPAPRRQAAGLSLCG